MCVEYNKGSPDTHIKKKNKKTLIHGDQTWASRGSVSSLKLALKFFTQAWVVVAVVLGMTRGRVKTHGRVTSQFWAKIWAKSSYMLSIKLSIKLNNK